jgi:hypothetical protein
MDAATQAKLRNSFMSSFGEKVDSKILLSQQTPWKPCLSRELSTVRYFSFASASGTLKRWCVLA